MVNIFIILTFSLFFIECKKQSDIKIEDNKSNNLNQSINKIEFQKKGCLIFSKNNFPANFKGGCLLSICKDKKRPIMIFQVNSKFVYEEHLEGATFNGTWRINGDEIIVKGKQSDISVCGTQCEYGLSNSKFSTIEGCIQHCEDERTQLYGKPSIDIEFIYSFSINENQEIIGKLSEKELNKIAGRQPLKVDKSIIKKFDCFFPLE